MNKGKLTIAASLSLGLLFGGSSLLNQHEAHAASKTSYKYTYKCSTYHYKKKCYLVNKPVLNPVVSKPSEQTPVQQPSTQPEKPSATPEKPAGDNNVQSNISAFEQEVVTLTNKERTSRGLKALQIDPALSKVARAKSEDMQKKNYFSHTSPTYGSPFDMMKQFGITYKSAGENIAKGQKTPEEVVNAWMNSEGHRANILNASYTHIGVGYVSSGNIWTQQFIGK
ncbi:CAP domain-containing protein [Aciduricibacillus chroicocephali]|uniref:CAP domain-containing protein n=1 Tax=Aciduricibacillus chroicocephali TaxID=3054939 RepID=A0ABY9KYD9_9BACI|nr:CAP domain-containing protein [Bacillaceae bacterium 44XB]